MTLYYNWSFGRHRTATAVKLVEVGCLSISLSTIRAFLSRISRFTNASNNKVAKNKKWPAGWRTALHDSWPKVFFVVICYSLLVLSMRSLRGVLEPARFNFRRSAHVARKWLLLKEFSSLIMQNLSSRGCMRPAGKVKESCREKGFRWAEILLKLFLTKE